MKIAIRIFLLTLVVIYPLYTQTAILPLGSGTSLDPYKIETLENLFWLSQTVSIWDDNAYFIQTNDIDAGDTENWGVKGFSPIGNQSKQFQGQYNGKGHIIKKLHVDASSYAGLFGYTKNATIDSLGLTDIIISGYDYVGGLVGYNSSSTISDSYVTGTISEANNYIGGLVGVNDSSTISNSYVVVTVSGQASIGGLIGRNKSSSTVLNATAAGNVSGTNSIGGLIGENDSSTVSYSSAAVNVSGTQAFVGGLVGVNYTSIVSSSYSTGIVSGTNVNIGGLIGGNRLYSKVINTYATGDVTGTAGVGGLIGINEYYSSVANSYSTGRVSESSESGGFLGVNYMSEVINCYWNTETSKTTTGIGNDYSSSQTVNALTITQMKEKNSFTSWDFDSTWSINEGNSYPLLLSVDVPTAVNNFHPNSTNGYSLIIKNENTISHISGKVTFSIATAGPSDVKLMIYNMAGRLLYKNNINSNSYEKTVDITWNQRKLEGKGVYLVAARVYNRKDGSTHLLTTKMIR